SMSYGTLRDYQWKRLLDTLWSSVLLEGPLTKRFVPNQPAPTIAEIRYPAPTDTYSQHGVLKLGDSKIGVDVLVTRSLFECISISVPTGMFAIDPLGDNPEVLRTDEIKITAAYEQYKAIALQCYEVVPFELASIGWNRECQIVTELEVDQDKRQQLFHIGNFFAPLNTLKRLNVEPSTLQKLDNGLYWMPPKS
ncbi:MAG: hypothetical protein CUN55_14710, partial [Phototrophicales bacterium]